jgi:DNA-binding winged helix-turn-helix (wHTH) protein/predicted ATPase
MIHNTIHFGSFRLDSDPDRLSRGSEEIPLRAKSLSVLAYVARRPGRLVTKDELREQVWGTTHVSDTTLRVTVREIRAALDGDQTSRQYLETVPGRGYCFVPDPQTSPGLESVESQRAERPAEGDSGPVVGRQQEMEYLLNRFLEAEKGRRQLVFLGGEPGTGKTTLVQLFMKRLAGRRGATLVGGQCVMNFGAGESYGPVLEALGRLAAEPGGTALTGLLHRYAPMWLLQLPALVESEEYERLQHRVEGATQERMVRELNDVLERLTAQTTLVLVLEDLHWSDVATVELLTSIAQRPEPARLLILGTYRPADAVLRAPALRQAIRELQERGQCEVLDVELLTRREVGAYVAARLDGTDSEDVTDLVFQRSDGNALFMVNMFDHLVQAGAIRKLDGRWSLDSAAAALSQMPEGLGAFIQSRLDTLSAEERRTLETASVVGVEFDAAALTPGTSPGDLKQNLKRLDPQLEALARRTRLIEGCGVTEWPDGILSERYRFRHALYRDVLYQEIPEARRARLHRMIGEQLRAAYGAEDASLAAVLAVHFENGQDAWSAARYRRMAGDRAFGRHAYHEAAGHFGKALEAFDQARSRPANGGDLEHPLRWELEVCTTLGTTLSAIRGYTDPEVARINSRARSLIERLEDPVTQFPALFNMWSVSVVAADVAGCADLVAQMSELAAGTGSDELALMVSSFRSRTRFLLGDLAGCAEDMRRMLTPYDPLRLAEVHRRYGQVDHAIACLGVNGWLLWLQGYPEQALAHSREAGKLAERLDRPYGEAIAGYAALPTLQFRGDTVQLERQAKDLYRLCDEHGYVLWRAWATCFEGWAVGARGSLAEGIALMERGVDAWRGTGARTLVPYCLALLAELCLRAGRIDAAGERLAEARAQADSSGERWWEAELHRLQGEVLLAAADDGDRDGDSSDRAEACFRRALEVAGRQGATSLELRAALSLSRLRNSSDAHQPLREAVGRFSEGHDTADLRAAQTQLSLIQPPSGD